METLICLKVLDTIQQLLFPPLSAVTETQLRLRRLSINRPTVCQSLVNRYGYALANT